MSQNIIPCLTWVKTGVAKSRPEKVHLTADELKRVIEETKEDLEGPEIADDDVSSMSEGDMDEDEGAAEAAISKKRKKKKKKIKDDEEIEADEETDEETDKVVEDYGFDDYDDDIDEAEAVDNLAGMTYYEDNADDPYITLKDDVDSDDEDFMIKATDNMILVPRVKRDQSSMEVYIYNDNDGALYVHHEILLSSFPLAIEWINYNPEGSAGNFVAMGTMEPVIDIWDIDLVDSIEPAYTLGQKKKKKVKSTKKTGMVGGHTDAVLALSWNQHAHNVLASGSADETVALWDLSQGKVVKSIRKHTDKVQALAWHPFEAQTLLSGGFDKLVNLYDCRSPDDNMKNWTLHGEVEGIVWNQFSPYNFLASTDSGFIYLLDVRTDKTIFTLSAHSSPCTGISLSSQIPGLFVTSSTDKTMKIWDIQDNKPQMVHEKDLGQGELLCCSCCPDAPYVFAVGGSRDLAVLDIRESGDVRRHFEGRTASKAANQMPITDTEDISMTNLDIGATSSSPSTDITTEPVKFTADSNNSSSSYNKPTKKKKKKKPARK